MTNPFAILTLIAYSASIMLLFAYNKNGADHRLGVSLLAWGMLVLLAGSVIELCMHAKYISFFDAGRAVLLAVFLFCARGNVARLIFWSKKDGN